MQSKSRLRKVLELILAFVHAIYGEKNFSLLHKLYKFLKKKKKVCGEVMKEKEKKINFLRSPIIVGALIIH